MKTKPSLVGQTVVLSTGNTSRKVTILREYKSDGVRMYDVRGEQQFEPFQVIAEVYDKLFLTQKQPIRKGQNVKQTQYNKSHVNYSIKHAACVLMLFVSLFCKAQAWDEKPPAFDASLNITGAMRSNQDLGVTICAGVYGRRIPVSLFVGVNYMEFDNYKTESGIQTFSTVGYNGTLMLRVKSIDWRVMDFNVYSTLYRDEKKNFYEYGVRIGLMPNNRSRVSLSLGTIQERNYHSFCIGSTFSLYFWNGFSAY